MKSDTTIIKRQFLNSLKRGTGEAYLIVRDNPKIDFSNLLIKGALKNFGYDGQSENSRAQYIYDIYLQSNQQQKIRKAILKGLETEKEDTWSLTHLFDLVKIFAQQGDNEAKQTIFDRFLTNPIEYSDWVGYSEILELDGLEGLFYIAEKYGICIDKNPDNIQDNYIAKHFQDNNPNIKVFEELENAAKTNRFIKIYLDTIKQTEYNWKEQKDENIIYNDIIDEVLNSNPYISFIRGRELTESEVLKVAERLQMEKNKTKMEKLLYVFNYHKFPFDSEFILNIAKHKTNLNNRIKEFAIDALRFLQSDNIRQFALDKIKKTNQPATYANILISNYKEGDYKLLTSIAKKFKSEHIIEWLAISYIDIYTANKTTECKEPLEVLYSKMNCSIHRNDIIRILLDNNVLSDKLKEEVIYDCDLETRKLLDKN
ncbi:MAG: hypothetical protein WCL51_13305 [Bacteroidota bacterium]